MKRSFLTIIAIATALGVFVSPLSELQAQRISPDSGEEESSENEEEEAPQLLLPQREQAEDTADSREEEEIYNQSRVQSLLADSAAMRVEFEETIRELRSDSEAMREDYERRIQQLSDTIAQLQQRIEQLEQQQEQRSTRPEQASEPDEDTGSGELELPEELGDTSDETSDESTASRDAVFNPNTASLSDLKSIPNLNDRLAERIEWYRREVRPFESREDLRRVPGVDRQTYESIADYFHEGSY